MGEQKTKLFTQLLQKHYETFYGISGQRLLWEKGPIEKLHEDFYVLEFKPNKRHEFYTYCTVGMSLDRDDDNLIEIFIYSPYKDHSIVELLTMIVSYHRNSLPLNLHHTVNIGRPWLDNSNCDHCFLSRPYLDGDELECFDFEGEVYNCYWLIPITENERDYKIDKGCESLEQLFEDKQIDYLNPNRECLLSK